MATKVEDVFAADEITSNVVMNRVDDLALLRRENNPHRTNTGVFLDTKNGRYEAHVWNERDGSNHAAWILAEETWETSLNRLVDEGLVVPDEHRPTLEYLARTTFKNEKAHDFQQTSKINAAAKEEKQRVLFFRHLADSRVNRAPRGTGETTQGKNLLALMKEKAREGDAVAIEFLAAAGIK